MGGREHPKTTDQAFHVSPLAAPRSRNSPVAPAFSRSDWTRGRLQAKAYGAGSRQHGRGRGAVMAATTRWLPLLLCPPINTQELGGSGEGKERWYGGCSVRGRGASRCARFGSSLHEPTSTPDPHSRKKIGDKVGRGLRACIPQRGCGFLSRGLGRRAEGRKVFCVEGGRGKEARADPLGVCLRQG